VHNASIARITHAETVCAQLQDLALGRQFDVVLLASFLDNVPSAATRAAFLAACEQHVTDTGCVIIQQHPPDWFTGVTATEDQSDGITFRLRDLSRPEPGLLSATAEYQAGEQIWTHSFTARRLGRMRGAARRAGAGRASDVPSARRGGEAPAHRRSAAPAAAPPGNPASITSNAAASSAALSIMIM
jgi:hypothetical protein